MEANVTRLDSCQYLLVSQINSPLTHFADQCEQGSHDAITRYLRGEKVTPRLVWETVRAQVVLTPSGSGLCDDTVLDKHSSFAIELVRHHYRGNAKQVITGSGVVTWVYVHPMLDLFWRIASRLSAPEGDGQRKLEHVREMLTNVVSHKQLPLQAVLLDTWSAPKDLMLCIESVQKCSYCPRKDNRQGDDASGQQPSQRVAALAWTAAALAQGKRSKSKGFPKEPTVPLFRGVVSPHRTDDVVTNDLAQESTEATQEACGVRWQMEPWHRAGTQVTGLERCQCRQARMQRHHLGCALLVWGRRKALAAQTGRTVSQLKHGLLDEYLMQQLRNPSLRMVLA
jgi:hypothetical protein